ncbi:YwqJ-related putative deaminase [Streptomonospora nanhaiensis]|uniref:Uncharacterized protein n=1 Tax=Streptomonospora nanhaiensis TaxID=1323731 RepID=A0A853BVT8_9ACTN|nr:YwqJ-related putative deaminase [Streptomonospora nanhaiensis]MBV2367076.1 hypothetical protein [Streptomonospora nanhaiensis]MBX9390926.1 hypothetical protein [Streptomonospora nanhaiensis]NYI98607.1 hypothetical protein [Streptomonospora nanhaiensis]
MDYLRDLVRQRAQGMRGEVSGGRATQAGLGGLRASVNAVVLDRRTGAVSEAVNGRPYHVIADEDLHPVLARRLQEMLDAGPYQQWDRHTGERLPDTPFPHGDTPLRHAEIKALNLLLNLRGHGVGPDQMPEFLIDVMFTLVRGGPLPAPCCANCTRLVAGVLSNNNRNLFPPGHPEYTVISGER